MVGQARVRVQVLVVAAPAVSVRRPVVEGELRCGIGERSDALLEPTDRPVEEEGVGPPDVDLDQLYVKSAVASDGPRMKRIRPAPMGRAFRYVRRISHLQIVLAEKNRNGQSVTEDRHITVAAGQTTVVDFNRSSSK